MSIEEHLKSRNIWYQTVLHRPAPSASRLAGSLHISGRQVAKAVLVRAGEGYVLAVLPATAWIDLARLSEVLHGATVSLAGEDEIEERFTDCERGALPPFGDLYGLQTVVDASLAGNARIVCMGNRRHEGYRLRYRDYEALVAPTRARFASSADPRRPETARRQAG